MTADIDSRLEQIRARLGETYPDGFGVLAGKEMWHGLGCAYQASSSTGDDCDCFRTDVEFLLALVDGPDGPEQLARFLA